MSEIPKYLSLELDDNFDSYEAYFPYADEACLDGWYTRDQLRQLLSQMDEIHAQVLAQKESTNE